MEELSKVKTIINDKNLPQLTIELIGRLDIHTVPSIWQKCIDAQSKNKPEFLILDAKNINYCDGSGIALLQTLQKLQEKINKKFLVQNLNQNFQNLLDIATKQELTKIQLTEEDKRIRTTLGYVTIDILKNIYENIVFIGILSYQLIHTILHPKTLRWKDVWIACEDVGPKALPIIALIGFLIGLISTFQAAPTFGDFGVQLYLINLVSLGLVREMGPLMTAVMLSGRTASSFAAEIGTMKINQEIDALKTMGLNPVKFLIIPRVIATTIMTPILSVFLIFFGIIGCSVVMKTIGYPLDAFLNQLYSSIRIKDLVGGLIKVFAFGFVIASVGCLNGLKTTAGSRSVGSSTTKAVVSSIIMLVIVDGIFALIYYVLGV